MDEHLLFLKGCIHIFLDIDQNLLLMNVMLKPIDLGKIGLQCKLNSWLLDMKSIIQRVPHTFVCSLQIYNFDIK